MKKILPYIFIALMTVFTSQVNANSILQSLDTELSCDKDCCKKAAAEGKKCTKCKSSKSEKAACSKKKEAEGKATKKCCSSEKGKKCDKNAKSSCAKGEKKACCKKEKTCTKKSDKDSKE